MISVLKPDDGEPPGFSMRGTHTLLSIGVAASDITEPHSEFFNFSIFRIAILFKYSVNHFVMEKLKHF